jgi:hypothetical protein
LSAPLPDRLISHSEPVICAAISGEGGSTSDLAIRVSTMSGSAVAPSMATSSRA